MKEPEKTAVSRDDLTDIVSAIETMHKSLMQLRASLAGIIPETPGAEQLQAIAGNTLTTLFPGVPYHIYIGMDRVTSGKHVCHIHSAFSLLLLILPHVAPTLSAAATLTGIDLSTGTGAGTAEAAFHYSTAPTRSITSALVNGYSALPLYASVSLREKTLTIKIKK